MICHYAVGKDQQPLLFAAVDQAVDYYIPVFISGKQVYPVDYCRSDKIRIGLVMDFIFSAHLDVGKLLSDRKISEKEMGNKGDL